jgi:hypothetical protein
VVERGELYLEVPMDTRMELVRIGTDEVEAVFDSDNNSWVALKRMCEVLGIDTPTQWQKLKESKWATVGLIPTVGTDGKLQASKYIF